MTTSTQMEVADLAKRVQDLEAGNISSAPRTADLRSPPDSQGSSRAPRSSTDDPVATVGGFHWNSEAVYMINKVKELYPTLLTPECGFVDMFTKGNTRSRTVFIRFKDVGCMWKFIKGLNASRADVPARVPGSAKDSEPVVQKLYASVCEDEQQQAHSRLMRRNVRICHLMRENVEGCLFKIVQPQYGNDRKGGSIWVKDEEDNGYKVYEKSGVHSKTQKDEWDRDVLQSLGVTQDAFDGVLAGMP